MIHKNNHRMRMRLGQHLLLGSTNTYIGQILAHNRKHRTWMGIDIHLPIWNLDDSWSTLASTSINNENHNWHACFRVVLSAV